ncbi:hypothetical protein PVAG01_09791 [Phlyctema vagabunda]|uniref:Zn(2)-C6 fungal-type domain-containing protein n=1 Tax=Phlyctema vagabunda TaxID=108571 RepID=A0ABR4P453_9HELO
MVYCGKPSKGCERCRKRKIRCSQQPEGCSQCMRAKQICPGYRAQVDVMFRNESDNVIRKAKVRAEKTKFKVARSSGDESSSSTPEWEDDSSSTTSLEVISRQPSRVGSPISYTMVPSIDDLATAYFVTHYVINFEEDGPVKGHLDHLTSLQKAHGIEDNLLASMKAVGLAGFAHDYKAHSLMVNARQQYIKAIQLTNAALRHPREVKKDSVLMSIMILGIFETVTGCNQKSIQAWQDHIHGAAAVVKLRGRDQLLTPAGRRLFIQTTSSLILSCIQRQMPVPKHITDLAEQAGVAAGIQGDAAWKVLTTMIDFAQFRSDLKTQKLTDTMTIFKKAMEIDGAFLSICKSPPKGWEFQTIYTDKDPDIIFNGYYHIYYDVWVAQNWNSIRTVRILLNEKMREILLDGFRAVPPQFTSLEHTAQFQLSTDTIYILQAEILASVPQHLGYISTVEKPRLAFDPTRSINPPSIEKAFSTLQHVWSAGNEETSSRQNNNPHSLPAIRASAGIFLMWPLWFAGIIDVATEEVRDFVIRNLKLIGTKMGVQQANMLADLVKGRQEIEVWSAPPRPVIEEEVDSAMDSSRFRGL